MINLFFKKLAELKQVAFRFQMRLILLQIKRLLKMRVRGQDQQLHAFLTTHLVKYDGFLIDADQLTFTARLKTEPQVNVVVAMRKPPSSDFDVFQQVLANKEYAPLIHLLVNNQVRYSDALTIIDAGANIGLCTLYLKSKFPNSAIIAVEPDHENFQLLTRNVLLNSYNDVRAIQGGIWNREMYLNVQRDFRDGNDWSVRVVESEQDTGIKAYTIEALLNEAKWGTVDILKIDIEGAEKMLFASCETASVFLSKTKFIAIEIHDEFDCRDEILMCLSKHGFALHAAGETTIGINRNLV